MGIKASHILKKYVEGAESMNAYVKFTNLKSAEEACSLNGTKLGGLTLRVSLCTVKELDYKTTIFVGNLPLNITEEELRNHFNTIGKIDNVRVIKNKYTSLGIGIGYVKFAEK